MLCNFLNKMSAVLLIGFVWLLHLITISQAGGMKCVVMLENTEQRGKVVEACSKSNKVDETKLKNFSVNTTLEEFDLDDNVSTLNFSRMYD